MLAYLAFCLSQQLPLSHFVYPECRTDASNELSVEGHECQWNIIGLRLKARQTLTL